MKIEFESHLRDKLSHNTAWVALHSTRTLCVIRPKTYVIPTTKPKS